MNRVINRRQAICGTVWIVVVCAVLALWPLRLVNETIVSDSKKQMVMESEEITSDYVVQQMFIAQYDKLKNIDIYFTDGTVGEEFNFVLYDAAMNRIMQQIIKTEDMEAIPGYCRVQVNIDTEVGREYYFLLQGIDGAFRVAYEDRETSGNIYSGTLYYGNVEDTDHCIITSYEYEVPLRKGRTLACDALFVLSGILVSVFTGRYYRKRPEKNTLLTVERTVRAVCNPLVVAAGALSCIAVYPCRLFTTNTVSIIFYEASIVLTVGLLLYAVNHNRTGLATDRTVFDLLKENWQNFLQSALFAGAIWACCNYMNGLYEIHHTVAYRQQLIFFALSVIVTYKAKDLWNLLNLGYLVLAVLVGLRYYNNTVAALENPEELEILVVKLTVWAGILSGLVIWGSVRFLVRGQVRNLSVWYCVLVGIFFAMIIRYRNTRGWPIYLVCSFVLFYLNMAAWDKKAALLRNICNGILLHFGAMVIYCLLHRPYMFFQYYRYPFIFHTVTMSAVYLALVVCAAMVKFLDAYGKRPKLAAVYKELFMVGVSAVYLLLTLSRTGYLAIVVTALIMIPVACFSLRHRWRGILNCIGMMLIAAVLCFPMTFTAQRMIPAVAASPKMHEIEELPTEIMHGRYMDSYYYITIQRFIQVFQMKILGIPEEKSLRAIYMVSDAGEEIPGHSLLVKEGEILLASSQDMVANGEDTKNESDSAETPGQEFEEEESYTNGRLEIFRLYYQNLNQIGHDDMGIMEPNGNYNVHAHNIYLQVAYDHGIYVGFLFLVLGAGTLVQAAVYFHKRKNDRVCAALPLALLILFAVAGLTEWIFHPCNSIAFCLLLTMTPLLVENHKAV